MCGHGKVPPPPLQMAYCLAACPTFPSAPAMTESVTQQEPSVHTSSVCLPTT